MDVKNGGQFPWENFKGCYKETKKKKFLLMRDDFHLQSTCFSFVREVSSNKTFEL